MVESPAHAIVRGYRPSDHLACRALWNQLVEVHRELYDDPSFGGRDPGAAFEGYLTRLDLTGMWVAEDSADGVVGLVGLILDGRAGAVEPVIVKKGHRKDGIGRALLGRVAAEARKRGLTHLSVSPEARDLPAIATLTASGYTNLVRVTLTLPLRGERGGEAGDSDQKVDLLGHELRY